MMTLMHQQEQNKLLFKIAMEDNVVTQRDSGSYLQGGGMGSRGGGECTKIVGISNYDPDKTA